MEVGDFVSYQFCQPPPLCKYSNFAANKLLPNGMILFFMLSKHIKHSNFVKIRMLCMQGGQNMNLFIGCGVFYGLDGTRIPFRFSQINLNCKMKDLLLSVYFSKACFYSFENSKNSLQNDLFLDASSHLYTIACPSVGPSVRWSVRIALVE